MHDHMIYDYMIINCQYQHIKKQQLPVSLWNICIVIVRYLFRLPVDILSKQELSKRSLVFNVNEINCQKASLGVFLMVGLSRIQTLGGKRFT